MLRGERQQEEHVHQVRDEVPTQLEEVETGKSARKKIEKLLLLREHTRTAIYITLLPNGICKTFLTPSIGMIAIVSRGLGELVVLDTEIAHHVLGEAPNLVREEVTLRLVGEASAKSI